MIQYTLEFFKVYVDVISDDFILNKSCSNNYEENFFFIKKKKVTMYTEKIKIRKDLSIHKKTMENFRQK